MHRKSFSLITEQSTKLSAVMGRQMEQKKKSEMVREITNAVVGCFMILGQFSKAAKVKMFRKMPRQLMVMEETTATGRWDFGRAMGWWKII